jgi:hypothetical protein
MADRITLSRAKGWRKPDGAVIVSRPSIWGNPWGIGTPGTLDVALDGARVRYKTLIASDGQEVRDAFENWLRYSSFRSDMLPDLYQLTDAGRAALRDHLHGRRKLILSEIHTLRGRDLCCWCKPGTPCHADVLMEIANG